MTLLLALLFLAACLAGCYLELRRQYRASWRLPARREREIRRWGR